jgi:hypothetical protein
MSKQTTVEWIEYQVQQQGITHFFSIKEILQQAKEMEKTQIIDAVNSQRQLGWDEKGEQYYTDTYKGGKHE